MSWFASPPGKRLTFSTSHVDPSSSSSSNSDLSTPSPNSAKSSEGLGNAIGIFSDPTLATQQSSALLPPPPLPDFDTPVVPDNYLHEKVLEINLPPTEDNKLEKSKDIRKRRKKEKKKDKKQKKKDVNSLLAPPSTIDDDSSETVPDRYLGKLQSNRVSKEQFNVSALKIDPQIQTELQKPSKKDSEERGSTSRDLRPVPHKYLGIPQPGKSAADNDEPEGEYAIANFGQTITVEEQDYATSGRDLLSVEAKQKTSAATPRSSHDSRSDNKAMAGSAKSKLNEPCDISPEERAEYASCYTEDAIKIASKNRQQQQLGHYSHDRNTEVGPVRQKNTKERHLSEANIRSPPTKAVSLVPNPLIILSTEDSDEEDFVYEDEHEREVISKKKRSSRSMNSATREALDAAHQNEHFQLKERSAVENPLARNLSSPPPSIEGPTSTRSLSSPERISKQFRYGGVVIEEIHDEGKDIPIDHNASSPNSPSPPPLIEAPEGLESPVPASSYNLFITSPHAPDPISVPSDPMPVPNRALPHVFYDECYFYHRSSPYVNPTHPSHPSAHSLEQIRRENALPHQPPLASEAGAATVNTADHSVHSQNHRKRWSRTIALLAIATSCTCLCVVALAGGIAGALLYRRSSGNRTATRRSMTRVTNDEYNLRSSIGTTAMPTLPHTVLSSNPVQN